MINILHIDAGIFGENSQSSQLSKDFIAAYQDRHGSADVTYRSLAANPLPHLDATIVAGFMTPEGERSAEQTAAAALSTTAIAELQAADVLVLGLPMYNFGVPSSLKAWIDHVARAGLTFRYTENGPEGLLTGKKAFVLAARGGLYAGTGNDHQTPYIRQILGFLGITDVEFVYAEGLNINEQSKAAALAAARLEIAAVAAGERQPVAA